MRRVMLATRPAGAIVLAGLLIACLAIPARGQPTDRPFDSFDDGDWLELSTRGTVGHFSPRAIVRLERAAYVAVFEVEPGVGATLLHPSDGDDQIRLPPGEHALRLNGLQQAFHRRLTLAHLGPAFAHRDPVVPYNHLVAVAATGPLRLGQLLSGHVFEHSHAYAGVEEVTGALLAEVLGERTADAWTIARSSYLKFRSEQLLLTFTDIQQDAPFLVTGAEIQLPGLVDWTGVPALARGLVPSPADVRPPEEATARRPNGRSAAGDRSAPTPAPEASRELDADRRGLLAWVADARRTLGRGGARDLERLGAALRRVGADVPVLRPRRSAADRRAGASSRADRLRRLLPGASPARSGRGGGGLGGLGIARPASRPDAPNGWTGTRVHRPGLPHAGPRPGSLPGRKPGPRVELPDPDLPERGGDPD